MIQWKTFNNINKKKRENGSGLVFIELVLFTSCSYSRVDYHSIVAKDDCMNGNVWIETVGQLFNDDDAEEEGKQ